MLTVLLLSAAIDGEAALRHASALAALGPHPWGSPRNRAAAEYVAVQFREAGLGEVRRQDFETAGVAGTNVIGVLRTAGPEVVIVGAHHDTAPEAPGAYDDGGGVGVLVELARALGREPARTRTFVFASFDGEEAWSTGKATTAGSRAYIKSLGSDARNVVAAFVIEMCGWAGGTPVLHTIPYRDPRETGRSVVTPAWLARAALAGGSFRLGDPLIPWLYQPTLRTLRGQYYGDDLSFLQAGLPAVFVSDSSFRSFYPWYHRAGDTADKLDAASLARLGEASLQVLRALDRVPRGPAEQPQWFAAFGYVIDEPWLYALGVLSVLPGLRSGVRKGGVMLAARLFHALLFAYLLWRFPVPALWIFLLANLLTPAGSCWLGPPSLLPPLALLAVGALAYRQGAVVGTWLAPWDVAVSMLAFALLFLRGGPGPMRRTGRRRRAPA
jgi:hypothetical protein